MNKYIFKMATNYMFDLQKCELIITRKNPICSTPFLWSSCAKQNNSLWKQAYFNYTYELYTMLSLLKYIF